MKKLFLIGLTVVLALSAGTAFAWVGEEDLGIQGSTGVGDIKTLYLNSMRTLDPDTLYHLHGIVYVNDGATLNIPAGTTIFGHEFGTLVVRPGGTINATGTQAEPIVFTSHKDPGQRFPGDWGGIVLLGKATVNKTNPNIEGGIIEDSLFGSGPECPPEYPDCDNDSSGIFRYVRIEYPGYRFQDGNEINGLTMGGVGAGTELHHVQVSYSWDDSYEWFGGTVNAKYLVAFGGTDDEFDTDFGYRGKNQFLFGLRDPDYWDSDASNGFESDNDDPATEQTPRTAPIVTNATLAGPERTDALAALDMASTGGRRFQDVARPRRHTRLSVFNSVLFGYQKGMAVRNTITQGEAEAGILRWQNISMANEEPSSDDCGTGYPNAIHDCGDWADVCDWFTTPSFNNWGSDARVPSSLGLTDMSDLNDPNPVPASGSELIGSADFSDSYLADAFFDVVDYRGAFDPSKAMSQQWTAYWTNFDPQNTVYDGVTPVEDEIVVPMHRAMVKAYPNPFNPATTISFSAPKAGNATLTVFDARGRQIATLFDGTVNANSTYSVDFNGEGLASGMYFYRLTGDGFSATEKMQLVK